MTFARLARTTTGDEDSSRASFADRGRICATATWPLVGCAAENAALAPQKTPTCSLFAECPAEPPLLDCLRAAVLFRTPYKRAKCCFRCRLLYWLETSRLADNTGYLGLVYKLRSCINIR